MLYNMIIYMLCSSNDYVLYNSYVIVTWYDSIITIYYIKMILL